jgi:hypothetical protein
LIDCALAAAGRQDSRGLRKIKQPIGLVTTVSHRCQPVFYFPRAVQPMLRWAITAEIESAQQNR